MASEKVREFCRKLADALEADDWGMIDPIWIRNIADNPPIGWLSTEERANSDALADILEKAL